MTTIPRDWDYASVIDRNDVGLTVARRGPRIFLQIDDPRGVGRIDITHTPGTIGKAITDATVDAAAWQRQNSGGGQ